MLQIKYLIGYTWSIFTLLTINAFGKHNKDEKVNGVTIHMLTKPWSLNLYANSDLRVSQIYNNIFQRLLHYDLIRIVILK